MGIKNVKDNADENCVFLLVGNKSDLEKNTNYNLINDLCKKYNMEYVETSAIKNINVTNIFSNISDILYTKYILNKKNNYIYDLTYNQNILTINDEETNNKDKFNRYIYSYC